MGKRLTIGLLGLLVIGALVFVTAGTVLAQEETPAPVPKHFGWHRHGPVFGRGLGGQVGLEAAAEALGMTADELSTQLWGGRSLADLADAAGVELQEVQDAVAAAHEAAMVNAIEQAVEEGRLTREHADWLLEGHEKGYIGGGRMGGFGGYHGGFRGGGGFGRLPGGRGGFGGFRQFPGRTNTGTSGA